MGRTARKAQSAPVDSDQPLLPIHAPQRQRSRIGKKTIGGTFELPLARAFAVLAAREDRDKQELLEEAIRDLLEKYGQELIVK